ncbi:hypothetical protein MNBD_DELTA02-649 [hydrothermal vent metagenome]|uniref:DUF2231 domain-containing protein n=1 Tax=hydrothermal vent metagenome TaxID=652676 RepID=A0A3B0V0U4_9ZZZZ
MEIFAGILPGIAEMKNIHPVFVHFPIALLNGFLLMEVLGAITDKESLRSAATWMLYLGTLGAIVTVITGLVASGSVEHGGGVHELMLDHRNHGLGVLALAIILSIWRLAVSARFSTKSRIAHFILAVIMVGNMTIGADMGGLMVYKYGVSVKAVPQVEGGGHDHSGSGGHENMMEEMKGMKEMKGHQDAEGAAPHDD